MPTPWKRSPEELHKTYIANTEAFYKVAGRGLAQELDEFVVRGFSSLIFFPARRIRSLPISQMLL